ncbi:hypothetical protein [Bacteriovorax sp. Seq25_V]|uniref:hypothetical protein n=1 Tax=Bacteriovorax sp. Seq25_V TaxID=1201288 RepID=UPI00038A230F|nr:hypothetical protein [Bacteriovorax sp. Seq25_V]EQC43858.1 hypothetical protein M900_1261 [Bacteriovorax sp. Seq25_V]
MAKIYKDFNELVEQNKGLFNAVGKSRNYGILEAIWNARNHEVESLKGKVSKLETANKNFSDDNTLLEKQREILCHELNQSQKKAELLLVENKEIKNKYDITLKKYQELDSTSQRRELQCRDIISEREVLAARIEKLSSEKELLKLEISETIEGAKAEIAKREREIEQLAFLRDDLQAQVSSLQSQITNLTTQNENLEVSLERSADRISELKSTVERSQLNLSTIKKELAQKRNEVEYFSECFAKFEGSLKKKMNLKRIDSEVSQ